MSDKHAGHSKQTAKTTESTSHRAAQEVHHAPPKGHVESWKESGLKLLGQLSHKAKEGLKIISGSHSGTICDKSKTKDGHATAAKSGDKRAKSNDSVRDHVKRPEPVLHRDKDGRVNEVVARNGNKFEVAYKPGKGHEVASVTIKDGKGRPVIGEQPNQAVAYKVNQRTGEVTTAFRDSVDAKDSTGKLTKVQITVEAHFTPEGTSAVIRKDLSGRRIDKTVSGVDGEKLAVLNYSYHLDQHGKDAGVTVDQLDHRERLTHRVRFATADHVEQQKAVERKDWRYSKRNGKESETCDHYDLKSGKEERVSHFEKSRDLAHGVTDVVEQKFRHGREYEIKQSQFDKDGIPSKLHYHNRDTAINATFTFDKNGSPKDVSGTIAGDGVNDHRATLLQIAKVEIAITRNHTHVREINAEEVLANSRPTAARDGEKASGIIAWKDGDQYRQGRVKDGQVLGADGKPVGKVGDNGDVTIGNTKFNILKDDKYGAVFHGVGTDGDRLDLCPASTAKSEQSLELNGFLTNGKEKIQSVGSNLFRDGKFFAHVNKDGTMAFATDLEQKEHGGIHISKVLTGGWSFVGNDGGKERKFDVSDCSKGQIALAQLDAQGKLKLGPDGKPLGLIDCDVDMGMIISLHDGKQIGKLKLPRATDGKNLTDAEVTLFSDNPDREPTKRLLSSFSLSTFKLTDSGAGTTVRGAVLGPAELQADGSPRPGCGGILDLDRALKKSDENFKGKVVEAKAGLDKEAAIRDGVGLAIDTNLLPVALKPVKELSGDLVNQAFANDAQTDSTMAAMQMARKQNREDHAAIEKMLASGGVDAAALARLDHLIEVNQKADLDPLARLKAKADNPEHILETVPAKAAVVIKIPDGQNPGKQIELQGKDGVIFDAKSGRASGHYDAASGALVLLDAAGRPLSRSMTDKQFTGATVNLQYQDVAGKPRTTVWVNDGTGQLQSMDQLRKQVATERAYVQLLAKNSSSEESGKRLNRTIDLEGRYLALIKNVEQNGITDLAKPQDRFSILEQIKGGAKAHVRSEFDRLPSHAEATKSSLPKLNSIEDCQKVTGPMRLGHDHYFVDAGYVYRTKKVGDKWEKTGETCGTLEPGYLLNFNDRKVSLAGKDQVLFQFNIAGSTRDYKVIGFGEPARDGSGSPMPAGLIEVSDLRKQATEAERSTATAQKQYSDSIGYATIGLPDYFMGGREAQLGLVHDSSKNQSKAVGDTIDNIFLKGLSGSDLSSAEMSQQVHTVQKFVKDLGLTTVDAKELSQEGISMQKQSNDALATAALSFVPGGALRLGTVLNYGRLGKVGLTAMGGGLVSSAVRQSHGTTSEEFLNNYAAGNFEALSMLVGKKAPDLIKGLKIAPEGSAKMLEVYLKPKAAEYLTHAANYGLQGAARFTKAGIETAGFAMSGASRTGDFGELAPHKLLEGTLFMLAGEGAEKILNNRFTKLGRKYGVPEGAVGLESFENGVTLGDRKKAIKDLILGGVDHYVDGFAGGTLNNMVNSALVAKGQAVEEEKQRIADLKGIDRSLVTDKLFEQYKDQSRINAYVMRSAAEAGFTNVFTHPVSSYLTKAGEPHFTSPQSPIYVTEEHGRVTKMASEQGEVEFKYSQSAGLHFVSEVIQRDGNNVRARWTSEDGRNWQDQSNGQTFQGRCHPHPSGAVLLENEQGRTYFQTNGTTRYAPAGGGQFVKKDGLIVQVNDATGSGTDIQYDQAGKPKALTISSKDGVEHLSRTAEGWHLQVEGQKNVVPLKGEINVTVDGKVVFSDELGQHHVRHLDGRQELISSGAPEAEPVAPRPLELRAGPENSLIARTADGHERLIDIRETETVDKFREIVSSHVSDPTLSRHISEGMHQFAERLICSGVERSELVKTLEYVNRVLTDTGSDSSLSAAEKHYRQSVISDFLLVSAHPTYLSQEGRSTCLPTAAVARLLSTHPAEAARILADALTAGKCYLPDGSSFKITRSELPYNSAAEPSMEILEKALIGASHFETIEFAGVQMPKGSICYHNDQLCDSRTNPPTPLPPRHPEDASFGPKMQAPQLVEGWKRIIGAKEDFVILSDRYAHSDQLPAHNVFDSAESLGQRLFQMKHDKDGPLLIQVNCGFEPFLSDYGGIANSGEHMVSIHNIEFDLPSGKRSLSELYNERGLPKVIDPERVWVTVDNTWDKSSDNPMRKIRLSELHQAASCATKEEKLEFVTAQYLSNPNDRFKRLDFLHCVYQEMTAEQRPLAEKQQLLEHVKKLLVEKELEINSRVKRLDLKVQSVDDAAYIEEKKFLRKARFMVSRIEGGLPLTELPRDVAPASSQVHAANRRSAEPLAVRYRESNQSDWTGLAKRVEPTLEQVASAERVRDMASQLREIAFTHAVSGAPNRLARDEHLRELYASKANFVLAEIDLINFASVNKNHGQRNGDNALIAFHAAATNVLKAAGIDATVYHTAGDEFSVIVRDVDQAEKALQLIQSVRVSFSKVEKVKGSGADEQAPERIKEIDFIPSIDAEKEIRVQALDDSKSDLRIHIANTEKLIQDQDSRTERRKASHDRPADPEHDLVVWPAIAGITPKPDESLSDFCKRADHAMEHNKKISKRNIDASVYFPPESFTLINPQIDHHSGKLDGQRLEQKPLSESEQILPKLESLYKKSLYKMDEHELSNLLDEARQLKDAYLSMAKLTRHAGLPDSNVTISMLDSRIAASLAEKQTTKNMSVIRLAVDNFKHVNDHAKIGHDGGDKLLAFHGKFVRDISKRFNIEVEIGTFDGDAILVLKNKQDAERLASILQKTFFVASEKAQREVSGPRSSFDPKTEVMVGYSVGVSHLRENDTREKLLRRVEDSLVENKSDRESQGLRLPRVSSDYKARTEEQAALSRAEKAAERAERKEKPAVLDRVDVQHAKSFSFPDLATLPDHGRRNLIETHLRMGSHPFVDHANMLRFHDAIENLKVGLIRPLAKVGDQPVTVEAARKQLEELVNSERKNLRAPEIVIKAVPDDAWPDNVNMAYRSAHGEIWVRERDLRNPRFLQSSTIYHELLHAEQDACKLRGAAVSLLRRTGKIDLDGVVAEYAKRTGSEVPVVGEREFFAKILQDSMPYIEKAAALSARELIQDPEFNRSRRLSRSQKHQKEVSFEKVDAQRAELADGAPFKIEPLDFLGAIRSDPEKQERAFGYKLLDSKYDTKDKVVLARLGSADDARRLLFGSQSELARYLSPELMPGSEKVLARLQLKALMSGLHDADPASDANDTKKVLLSAELKPQLEKLLVNSLHEAANQSERLTWKKYMTVNELESNFVDHELKRVARLQVETVRQEREREANEHFGGLISLVTEALPRDKFKFDPFFLSLDSPKAEDFSDHLGAIFKTIHEQSEGEVESDSSAVNQMIGGEGAAVLNNHLHRSTGAIDEHESGASGKRSQGNESSVVPRDLTNLAEEGSGQVLDRSQMQPLSTEATLNLHRYNEALRIFQRNQALRID